MEADIVISRQADHCARGMVFAVNAGAQLGEVAASARQTY
jgi:hypothetical protein